LHEGGDHGSVGPAELRPSFPPLEHGELVAQDKISITLMVSDQGAQHHPAQERAEHHLSSSATG